MMIATPLPLMSKTSPFREIQDHEDAQRDTTWALVELIGYQQFAGRISDVNVAGKQCVRLDVAETSRHKPYFCLFSIESVFKITTITQAQAEKINRDREAGRFAFNNHELAPKSRLVIKRSRQISIIENPAEVNHA